MQNHKVMRAMVLSLLFGSSMSLFTMDYSNTTTKKEPTYEYFTNKIIPITYKKLEDIICSTDGDNPKLDTFLNFISTQTNKPNIPLGHVITTIFTKNKKSQRFDCFYAIENTCPIFISFIKTNEKTDLIKTYQNIAYNQKEYKIFFNTSRREALKQKKLKSK